MRRHPGRWVWPAGVTAMAALLSLAPGCGGPRTAWVLALPEPGVRPAAHIDGVYSYRHAAVTTLAILERDFGFAPFPVAIYFHPTREAFEAALLASGYPPDLADRTARTVSAVGGHRRVVVNEAQFGPLDWPARLGTLAHELVHSLQYEWGGGRRGASDQWLREGFADWLAAHVLERLGALPMAAVRDRRREELRGMRRVDAPRLDDMATFPAWVALAARHELRVYALAFLAADAIIAQHGLPAVAAYFQRFAGSDDRLGHFHAAFGEELSAFEARVIPVLWSASAPSPARGGGAPN